MFKPGEYIHYSSSGLCRVEEVTRLQLSGVSDERLYYRLTPVDGRSTIFTPVDNPKVSMRPALSAKQADELIDRIPQIGTLSIEEEKKRQQVYKEALMSSDCTEWVKIIKTLYLRMKERTASGRKATSTDERYMRSAQDRLYTELAMALGKEKEDMEEYITEAIEHAAK